MNTADAAPRRSLWLRAVVGVWALPNSALGMLAGVLVLALGGRARCVGGILEFSDGRLGTALASLPARVRFSAMTLGHVILGTSASELARVRAHEHVHVRQYERWGPFFLPAYACSSAWQALCGRRAYRDNHFERQAYAAEGDGVFSAECME
jgi:hypothetical protein